VSGVDWLEPVGFSVLVAVVEFGIAAMLAVRLFFALGRRPNSPRLVWMDKLAMSPSSKRRYDALLFMVALIAYQLAPLSRERLFGGGLPPDHISGVAVIVAEVLFISWLLLVTLPGDRRNDRGKAN
jgi:hypothetical protein